MFEDCRRRGREEKKENTHIHTHARRNEEWDDRKEKGKRDEGRRKESQSGKDF